MSLIAKITATVHDGKGGVKTIKAGELLQGLSDGAIQRLKALGATAEAPAAAATPTPTPTVAAKGTKAAAVSAEASTSTSSPAPASSAS